MNEFLQCSICDAAWSLVAKRRLVGTGHVLTGVGFTQSLLTYEAITPRCVLYKASCRITILLTYYRLLRCHR